jgi:hypothetical protein
MEELTGKGFDTVVKWLTGREEAEEQLMRFLQKLLVKERVR